MLPWVENEVVTSWDDEVATFWGVLTESGILSKIGSFCDTWTEASIGQEGGRRGAVGCMHRGGRGEGVDIVIWDQGGLGRQGPRGCMVDHTTMQDLLSCMMKISRMQVWAWYWARALLGSSRTDRADMRVADNKASGDPLLEDLPAVNIRVIVQHVV